MHLLIVCTAEGTHADVSIAQESHHIPEGIPGRVIGPGESFMDVPYWVWRGHVGRTVDVLLARSAAPAGSANPAQAREPGPTVPIPPGRVLDTAFQLIRRTPLPLAAVAVVLQFPISYVAATTTRPVSPAEAVRAFLLLPWGILGQSMLILLLAHAYHGAQPDLRRAAATFGRRAFVATGAALLTGLLVGAGMALAVIPGLVLSCLLFAVPAVAVLEQGGPLRAMMRGWKLAMSAGWSTFLTVAVLELLGYFVRESVKLMQGMGGVLTFAAVVMAFAGGAFQAMLSAAVITSFYYTLRAAREGYDIERLMEGPAAPSAAAA